jgi:hypothetical protein
MQELNENLHVLPENREIINKFCEGLRYSEMMFTKKLNLPENFILPPNFMFGP